MKVRIISNPITPYGSFDKGQILETPKFPEAFLIHLVEDANAAEYIEAKIIDPVIENKISPSIKKKRGRPKKIHSS